jgi:hypothetical protein
MSALPMLVLVLVVLSLIGYPLRRPIGQALLLRRAVRAPIGGLPATGVVAVVGRAVGDNLSSPLTNTPCVLWEVEVLERGYKTTRLLVRQSSTQTFTIDDGTGRVLVLPENAQLQLGDDGRQSNGLLSSISPEVITRLTQLGMPARQMTSQVERSLRVHERYVAPDALVFALGTIEHRGGQAILRAESDTPLYLADRDERAVQKRLYQRIGSAVGTMLLIVFGFGCCVTLSILDRQ